MTDNEATAILHESEADVDAWLRLPCEYHKIKEVWKFRVL